MGNQVYSKDNFAIYKVRSGYIVHNKDYKFEKAHTHCNRMYDAKRLIHHALTRTIPKRYNLRFLGSLIRITDGAFKERVDVIKRAKERKGPQQNYVNVQKGGV